jgi:hypothetical protein
MILLLSQKKIDFFLFYFLFEGHEVSACQGPLAERCMARCQDPGDSRTLSHRFFLGFSDITFYNETCSFFRILRF